MFNFGFAPNTKRTTSKVNDGTDQALSYSFLTSTADRPMKLEADELLREERVLDNARADGRQNLPRTESNEPSIVEQRVFERLMVIVVSFVHYASKKLREMVVAVEGIRLLPIMIRLKELCPAANLAIKKLLADARDALVQAYMDERLQYRGLCYFQREHGLNRVARYPSDNVLPWLWFLLAIVGVIESALNAHFWAPINEHGLVGGFVRAAFISLLNLIPAVLVGIHVVPKLVYAHIAKRAFAWLLFVFWIIWIGVYNVFIGHWRVTSESSISATSMQNALDSLISAPLSGLLASGDAVMLVIAGIVAAIIAAIDAFFLDDPYYGYGDVDRRHKKARHAYEVLKKTTRTQVSDIVERYDHEVTQIATTAPDRVCDATGVLNQSVMVNQEYETSVDVHQRILETVLRAYRDENRRVRTTPTPTYFQNFPALGKTDLTPIVAGIARHRQDLMETVEQINATVEGVKGCLHRVAEKQIEDLVAFVEGVESDVLKKFGDFGDTSPFPALPTSRSKS